MHTWSILLTLNNIFKIEISLFKLLIASFKTEWEIEIITVEYCTLIPKNWCCSIEERVINNALLFMSNTQGTPRLSRDSKTCPGRIGPELTAWMSLGLVGLSHFHTPRQFSFPYPMSSTFLLLVPQYFPLWTPFSSPISYSPQKNLGKQSWLFFFLWSLPLGLLYFHSQISFGPALVLWYLQRKPTQERVPLERVQISRFEVTALPKPKLENWSKQLLKKPTY